MAHHDCGVHRPDDYRHDTSSRMDHLIDHWVLRLSLVCLHLWWHLLSVENRVVAFVEIWVLTYPGHGFSVF